jgi:hypothetical protein
VDGLANGEVILRCWSGRGFQTGRPRSQ